MTAPEAGYLVVGFGEPAQILRGFDRLAALAAAGEIEVVDVEFVHSIHGVPSTVTASGVDAALAGFDGRDTGLLGQSDLDAVARAIPPGSRAAAVIYRAGVILPALAQWDADGATVVAEGTFEPGTGLSGPIS